MLERFHNGCACLLLVHTNVTSWHWSANGRSIIIHTCITMPMLLRASESRSLRQRWPHCCSITSVYSYARLYNQMPAYECLRWNRVCANCRKQIHWARSCITPSQLPAWYVPKVSLSPNEITVCQLGLVRISSAHLPIQCGNPNSVSWARRGIQISCYYAVVFCWLCVCVSLFK